MYGLSYMRALILLSARNWWTPWSFPGSFVGMCFCIVTSKQYGWGCHYNAMHFFPFDVDNLWMRTSHYATAFFLVVWFLSSMVNVKLACRSLHLRPAVLTTTQVIAFLFNLGVMYLLFSLVANFLVPVVSICSESSESGASLVWHISRHQSAGSISIHAHAHGTQNSLHGLRSVARYAYVALLQRWE